MKFLKLSLVLLCTSFASLSFAQNQINWVTWDEAQELSETEKRKIFVDIYTKWCGWCKKMDKSTFRDSSIVKYINEHYYAVKFDAEDRNNIKINNEVYEYVNAGKAGYNTLAVKLTKGRMGYPTIAFLDEGFELIQPIPGYRNPKELDMILHYIYGEHFKKTPWKSYAREYQPQKKRLQTPLKRNRQNAQPVKYDN